MPAKSPSRGSSRSRTKTLDSSPYRWSLPPEADLEEDPLRVRLDFHEESVVVHDYAQGVARTKLVSALVVAQALAGELDLTTGLLPSGALWWARTSAGL